MTQTRFYFIFGFVLLLLFGGQKAISQVGSITDEKAEEIRQKSYFSDKYSRFDKSREIQTKTKNPKKMGKRVMGGSKDAERAFILLTSSDGKELDDSVTDIIAFSMVSVSAARRYDRNTTIHFLAHDEGSEEEITRKIFRPVNYNVRVNNAGLSTFYIEQVQFETVSLDELAKLCTKDVVEYKVGTDEAELSERTKKRILEFLKYIKHVS